MEKERNYALLFLWNMNLRITYEIMKEKMSLLVSKASEIGEVSDALFFI